MKLAKLSNFTGIDERENSPKKGNVQDYVSDVDKDLKNLFLMVQGRIRFGDMIDGGRGENISGEFHTFTTSATPDAENTIQHTIGAIPVGYLVLSQDKAGSLYNSTTVWTSGYIYLKCSVASVNFKIFLLK